MNEDNGNGLYIAPDEDEGVENTGAAADNAAPVEDTIIEPTAEPTEDEIVEPTEPNEEPATDAPSEAQEAECDGSLKPSNPYERLIADHLNALVADGNETLGAKIKEAVCGGYGINKCFDYIKSQARKQEKNGCAMIADDVVYGWAVHYFEDEWVEELKRDEQEKIDAEKRKKEADERTAKWEADRAKREAERKAEEEKAEEEKLAAMTAEEREAYLKEKARHEAELAEAKAKAEAAAAEAAKKRTEREEKKKQAEEKKKRAEELAKAQMTFF